MAHKCSNCGADLMPGITFCGFCGAKVTEQTTNETVGTGYTSPYGMGQQTQGTGYSQTSGYGQQSNPGYTQSQTFGQQTQGTTGYSQISGYGQQSNPGYTQSQSFGQQTQGTGYSQTSGYGQQAQGQYRQSPYTQYMNTSHLGADERIATTKESFMRLPQNNQLCKNIKGTAIACYIIAGLQIPLVLLLYGSLIESLLLPVFIDVAFLVGMGVGLHTKKSSVFAIILTAYAAINMIINLINGNGLSGWLILVVAIVALVNTKKLDNAWKNYKAQHNIP